MEATLPVVTQIYDGLNRRGCGMKKTVEGKKVCSICCDKPALFVSHKNPRVRADKDHDLCPRCYHSLLDSLYVLQAEWRGRPQADHLLAA
jgi:hypothetical protein